MNLRQHQRHVEDIGRTLARASFDKDVLYRRWSAMSGGVYAAQSEFFLPKPTHEVPGRDLTTPSGKNFTPMNSAYMTRQVLMNLLTNTRQAMDETGKLTLSTWESGTRIFLSIADTGCGIAPENLSRIFDPFFTTRKVGRGVGLGLSSAYDIVKNSSGDIKLASEPGKGATFTPSFPRSEMQS